jgi:hypothetical protein
MMHEIRKAQKTFIFSANYGFNPFYISFLNEMKKIAQFHNSKSILIACHRIRIV